MYQLIRWSWRTLSARRYQQRGGATPAKDADEGKPFREQLREAARRRLQLSPADAKSDQQELQLIRKQRRGRLHQQYLDLDRAAVNELAENVERVYQLIAETCPTRIRQRYPEKDEVELQMVMMLLAMPPTQLVESALVERIQFPAKDPMQQVATMMVDKVF